MKKLAIGMVVFCSLMALSVAAWCGDNGNGTITVNGLVWLKDAGCLGKMNWDNATARVKTLAHGQCSLTDNSKAGDWRLPALFELQSIYAQKSQFNNVQGFVYWSSLTDTLYPLNAYGLYMVNGGVGNYAKNNGVYVLPVR